MSFEKVVILEENVRQQGISLNQTKFRKCLNSIRLGMFNETDYQLLKTRFFINEINSFDLMNIKQQASHLYFTRNEVKEQNWERLLNTGHMILKIPSYNNYPKNIKMSETAETGLQKDLYLSINSRVIVHCKFVVRKRIM